MIEIQQTKAFAQCLDRLHDIQARARIQLGIESLAAGNAGDAEPVTDCYLGITNQA